MELLAWCHGTVISAVPSRESPLTLSAMECWDAPLRLIFANDSNTADIVTKMNTAVKVCRAPSRANLPLTLPSPSTTCTRSLSPDVLGLRQSLARHPFLLSSCPTSMCTHDVPSRSRVQVSRGHRSARSEVCRVRAKGLGRTALRPPRQPFRSSEASSAVTGGLLGRRI